MKRMLVLAALVCAASACAPVEQGNANLAAANVNRATPLATPAGVSEADLVAADRQIWEAIKAKNWDAFTSYLADDAITVTPRGVYDKAQSVEGLKTLDLTDYTVSDTRVVRASPDVAVLTYTSTVKGTEGGRPLPAGPSRDTTVFVNRGGRWLAAFHQETMVAPATPAASPATSPAASPAASPIASPIASPAASPAPPATVTEAEQQVWDALKRKDWAAFAAFLADDMIEVEADGVYTRAQSVENVKRFDFSTVTLSDFREVKLTPDVSVLTYTVRGTGADWPPNGMRHTTVWVRRGGRWQAVFHQGTNIER